MRILTVVVLSMLFSAEAFADSVVSGCRVDVPNMRTTLPEWVNPKYNVIQCEKASSSMQILSIAGERYSMEEAMVKLNRSPKHVCNLFSEPMQKIGEAIVRNPYPGGSPFLVIMYRDRYGTCQFTTELKSN